MGVACMFCALVVSCHVGSYVPCPLLLTDDYYSDSYSGRDGSSYLSGPRDKWVQSWALFLLPCRMLRPHALACHVLVAGTKGIYPLGVARKSRVFMGKHEPLIT